MTFSMASEVWFDRMVPVPGTSLRIDRFSESDGWQITETPHGVMLSREANDAQNIPGIGIFRVVGVGYSIVEVPAAPPESPKRGPAKVRKVPES